jgi:mannose-6-phosphate isomerase-like protein (cupin superfamily)
MSTQELPENPEREAQHQEAERRMQSFQYAKPESLGDANKGLVRLCNTDLMKGVVQVITEGGENNLHYHEGMDSFWMVLKGRAKFYGPGDKLVGEYGPFEGLVTPRGARYWFEKSSPDEDLELLQVASYDTSSAGPRRIPVDAEQPKSNRNQWFDGQDSNRPIEQSPA